MRVRLSDYFAAGRKTWEACVNSRSPAPLKPWRGCVMNERPFGPPLALNVKRLLIAEVHGELIKIGLDGDGRAGAEIKDSAPVCIRKAR